MGRPQAGTPLSVRSARQLTPVELVLAAKGALGDQRPWCCVCACARACLRVCLPVHETQQMGEGTCSHTHEQQRHAVRFHARSHTHIHIQAHTHTQVHTQAHPPKHTQADVQARGPTSGQQHVLELQLPHRRKVVLAAASGNDVQAWKEVHMMM